MSDRQARCQCGHTQPSADADRLAFFEFRGEGSKHATTLCHCGYALAAHDKPHVAAHHAKTRKEPAPRGPHEYDSFYCGCRGWD